MDENPLGEEKMDIKFPCNEIKMVDRELVVANSYNPNHVPKDKMELLKQSIIDNGFCFPIVVIWDTDLEKYVIVDGFHRWLICQKDWLDIKQIPVVILQHDISQRMAATVQFNKARGVHAVDMDADIVKGLLEQGMTEFDVSEHLGLDMDTIHRYKQLTGILDLFKNVNYSTSWEVTND
jgi:ParB-like chromosome segregation protein Spo0J